MAPEAGQAIRKKLQSTRERATPVARRLMAAWGEVVPAYAEEHLGIALNVGRLEARMTPLDVALSDIPETTLMIRIERDSGLLGLALVDQVVLTAILEVQTSGTVRRSEIAERIPTATDAMIFGDLLEPLMAATDTELEIFKGFDEYFGYRPTGHVPDTRAALMSLAEGVYRRTDITLDFEEGRRVGTVSLLYPLMETARPKKPDDKSLGEELTEAIMDAAVSIEAVLYTAQRSLGDISRFEVGDVVTVPLSALSDIRLKANDGALLGRARLGQLNGQRAIRIQAGALDEEEAARFDPASAAPKAAALPEPETAMPDLPDLPDLPDPSATQETSLPDLPPPPLDDLPSLDDLPPPPPPLDLPPLSERAGAAPNLDGLPELPPLID